MGDIDLYFPKSFDQVEILSQSRAKALNQFINILKDLADVFDMSSKLPINIFYDENTNSVAFNRDGKLFFNLKFYFELHEEECKNGLTTDAMTYWFTIFCHQLAHNFVKEHNSEFEVSNYYTV